MIFSRLSLQSGFFFTKRLKLPRCGYLNLFIAPQKRAGLTFRMPGMHAIPYIEIVQLCTITCTCFFCIQSKLADASQVWWNTFSKYTFCCCVDDDITKATHGMEAVGPFDTHATQLLLHTITYICHHTHNKMQLSFASEILFKPILLSYIYW